MLKLYKCIFYLIIILFQKIVNLYQSYVYINALTASKKSFKVLRLFYIYNFFLLNLARIKRFYK